MTWPNALTERRVWLRVGLPFAGLVGWSILAAQSHHPTDRMVWRLLGILAWEWTLTLLVLRFAMTKEYPWWLACGIAFRLIGLLAVPVLENDHYRFLWDGREFALNGSPYETTPEERFGDSSIPPEFADILDRVNYPDVPTIYGPVLEYAFLIGYQIAPAELWPWKWILLLADIALLWILPRLRPGAIGIRAAIFAAWCPLSVFETGFNAHPDGLVVALLAGAMLAARNNKRVSLGLMCGLAIAGKVVALLAAPFLLFRRDWRASLACFTTLTALYLPFWLQGSAADLAGLQAFTKAWEFNSSGYALIKLLAGEDLTRKLAPSLFVMVWLAIWSRWAQRRTGADPDLDPFPGMWVFGAFFLLSPTFNPWYALWLLPFVALRPGPSGIVALMSVSLSYLTWRNLGVGLVDGFGHPHWVRPLEFGVIAIALVAELVVLRASKNSTREPD